MLKKFKAYKISDLIKALRQQKKENGDLLVEIAADEEGNNYHPVGDYISQRDGQKNILVPFGVDDGKLQIYPCE